VILIEIISDENNLMFDGIPKEYHGKLLFLYNETLKHIINKPQFVKVSSMELIKKKFTMNNFQSFDVSQLINEFTKYYYDLKKRDIEKIRFGFLEDLEEFLLDYLISKDLLSHK
jgi:hypothetical protein